MKLKEFEIWAYKLSKSEARQISLFSRCVLAHFERVFQVIDTVDIYRIYIKITDDPSCFGDMEISCSVLKYYKPFDLVAFNQLDILSKKISLLDLVYNSLLELADKYEWNKDNFTEAYKAVVASEFVNHYVHQAKWNRSRNLQARVVCEHEPEVFRGSLVIVDKSNKVVFQQILFEEIPDEFFFNGRLGKISWLNNGLLRFTNNAGVKEFSVTG